MKILTLSGWGQPQDALATLFPHSTHVEYAKHATLDAALDEITRAAQDYDLVVGWSLGGQLAAHAVAKKRIAPKALVLIGAPFQFVETPPLAIGMKRDTFQKFRENYAANPARTLSKGWELIAYNDSRAEEVQQALAQFNKETVQRIDWLRWLNLLDGFTSHGLPFDHFPPSLILHGTEDAVVAYEQSQHFAKHIPGARLETFAGCGHAPHWHDPKRVQKLIQDFADV